ncbi:hypothetical protein ACFWMU_01945 [Streptomyces sp. NPDC058357]
MATEPQPAARTVVHGDDQRRRIPRGQSCHLPRSFSPGHQDISEQG